MIMLFFELFPAVLMLVALVVAVWLLMVDRHARRNDAEYVDLKMVPVRKSNPAQRAVMDTGIW
jgi:hypothetical protein